ncbi:MAG: ribonuclease R [Bacteroidales bacterium]|nr:ribonuclease R [Bacteroidales bacterium]
MAKSKKKKGATNGRLTKDEMIRRIEKFFKERPTQIYNYKQVARGIGVKSEPAKIEIAHILSKLQKEMFLTETDPGRYRCNPKKDLYEGTFQRKWNGLSVISDGDGTPISVKEEYSLNALSGDRVKYSLIKRRRSKEFEARIYEIVERAENNFVGILEVKKHYAFLTINNKTLEKDIYIPLDKLKGGKNGDKAIVRVTTWDPLASNPEGEVIDILGTPGENNTEMHAILAEFGLPYKYPENVEAAADKISEEITKDEISRREDFRGVNTFTIDPKDAKDFDDALSIKKLDNGNYEIGVHIADVTYYVQPDSVIDKEAFKRATSVYLVDRTIPMLPERLCNNLCSLRPNEDKLAFSAIFELNEDAEIINSRITRTVIRSVRRFAYEEAQMIIDSGNGEYCDEILKLNQLAQKLRDKRFKNGSIDFDRCEVRFEIDEKGKPISVYFKESKEANKLIEEFMLLANRTVAEKIGKVEKGKSKKAFVYRVHDLPDSVKMEDVAKFVRRLGYTLKADGTRNQLTNSIKNMLADAKKRPEANLIETITIRAMAKATYTTKNIGHYGLAFPYYTHFTSPIRRYPDMMVHRLLERYLDGGRSVNESHLEDACKHSSDMEIIAANAERASIKYKQAEYLGDRIGMVYDGTISGINKFGIYVEIDENKCEGMIPFRDFEDDYYEFDEKNYCARGRSLHKEYRLGDKIKIVIAKVDLERRLIDFSIANK